MKRFSLILSFLFGAIGGLGGLDAALVANPDSNTLWMENFDRIELADDGNLGWCNFEPDQMSVEIVDGKARLCETAPGSWGVLQRQVPIDPAGYRYLQIRVDQIENIKQYLSLGNANKGGRDMGKTLAGITTVDLTAQPGCDGGDLTLNLVQIGRDGTEPGGWVTVDWIRCVRKPVGGLTFDLIEKGQTNRTAEVGDTIQLRYFAGEPIPGKSVVARFYTTNHMLPYSFDGSEAVLLKDDGTDGDETAGDQVYSKAFVIGPDALSLTALEPAPGGTLLVSAAMGSEQTYAYSSCLFDIRTARKLDFSDDYGVTPLTVQNRMRWMREIKGENLALGKPVRFSLEADYSLTKEGGTDPADLTDGKLSGRADDKIWFDAAAVGWYFSKPTLGLNILIDLGSVQPIEKLVARFLGGAEQGGLFFPAEFAVVASEDGKTFHQVSSLIKLMPAERNRSGEPGNYYLPENGTAYTYPFVFPLKIRARYIGLAVKGAKDAVFCDEIAVIKGNFREGAKESLAARPVVPFVTEGLVFGPAKPLLAISTNIVTPNFFRLLDCRPLADRAKPATCVIELPAAVKVLPGIASTNVATEDFAEGGVKGRRWRFNDLRVFAQSPVFMSIDGELPADPQAVFYVESEGFAPNRVTVPILPIEIPKVPELEGFHVSLAWMTESTPLRWPEFFKAWRHLGFNTVSTFPRYWPAGDQPPAEIARWLTEARQLGFKVLYNESPFHMMVNNHKDEPELYSQLPGGPSKNPCPAYKGRFYQEEIQRVGDCFEKSNPDFVFYDIELWYNGGQEAGTCSLCLAWQKKSGKSMAECLMDMGTQMKTDMFNEIRARCRKLGRPMPVLAMYDLRAAEEVYQFVDSFARLYPAVIQWSQPSLYCLNRIGYAHESMKAEFKALGGKKGVIVPWLTAGTYGEADSSMVEALIFECFLNGAAGITYYCDTDFDTPLDFQAQARALATLAPYRELLRTGTTCEVPVATEGVLSSAWWNGKDELLLLLGNYDNSRAVRVRPTLPFAAGGVVTDAQTGTVLDPALPLEIEIPGQGLRLLHLRAAPARPAEGQEKP